MISNLEPYLAYKPSAIPWLGDVPAHWEVLPGKACYSLKQIPNKGLRETTVLSLSYGQIKIRPEERLHGLIPESFETYQIIEPADIICRPTDLQNDWTSLRFGLSPYAGIITSAYMCFHTRATLTREYGYTLLHTYDLKKVFYGLGSGLRQNLSWSDFKFLPCLAPPLPEQNAIVRYLDHVDRRIRRYVNAKRKLIALLEEEKQAIINQAVTRGLDPNVHLKPSGVEWLGDVPENREVRRLKTLCQMKSGEGITAESIEAIGKYPVYGGNGLRGYASAYTHDGAFALIGRQGALCGNVHVVRGQFWASEDAVVAALDTGHNIDWFGSVLTAMNLNQYSIAAAQPGLAVERVLNLHIPVPSLQEQLQVTYQINKATTGIAAAIARSRRQIDLVQEYRTRLIADVVTGKLDVREAAAQLPDEPDEEEPAGEDDSSEEGDGEFSPDGAAWTEASIPL